MLIYFYNWRYLGNKFLGSEALAFIIVQKHNENILIDNTFFNIMKSCEIVIIRKHSIKFSIK